MFKQLFILVIMSLFLVSCNDESVNNEKSVPDNTSVTFGNGATYIQLPNTWKNISGTVIEQIFPNPCEASITGKWVIADQFDSAFFRSEGARSNGFNAGFQNGGEFIANRTEIQIDTFQGHRHGVGQVGFGINHNDLAGGNTGIDYYKSGGNIDEMSYNTLGGKTLKNDVATSSDPSALIDNSISGNGIPRIENETRPLNYTARVWQKLDDTFGCALYESAYDVKVIEKQVITKDKNGNIIKTELVVDRVEKTPRLTSDGQKILKEIASYDEEEQAELVKEFDTKRQKVFIDKNAADITSKEISPKVKIIIQD